MDLSSPSDLEEICDRVFTAAYNMVFVDRGKQHGHMLIGWGMQWVLEIVE